MEGRGVEGEVEVERNAGMAVEVWRDKKGRWRNEGKWSVGKVKVWKEGTRRGGKGL